MGFGVDGSGLKLEGLGWQVRLGENLGEEGQRVVGEVEVVEVRQLEQVRSDVVDLVVLHR